MLDWQINALAFCGSHGKLKVVMLRRVSQGFALPTVVITSVVLFGVLVAVISSVSSVRATLNNQYQQALARDAAESGAAYAEYCYSIQAGTSDTTEWPRATTGPGLTLDNGDNCNGKPNTSLNCGTAGESSQCYVVKSGNVRTGFSVSRTSVSGISYTLKSVGTVDLMRSSTSTASGVKSSSSLMYAGYTQVSGLATGNDTSCAIQLGKLYCWGRNASGQAGVGNTTDVMVPVLVQGALTGKYVYDVATGINHACAIAGSTVTPTTTASIYCWGDNSMYQYGIGNTSSSTVPMLAASISGYYPVEITARDHTCVIAVSNTSSTTRKEYCWGDNIHPQAGESGAATASPTILDPKPTPGSPIRLRASPYNDLTSITSIDSVHRTTSCGIDSGKVFCIGNGTYGALGDGTTADNSRVKYVITTSNADLTGATKIVSNNGRVCAISAGKIYCWGANRADGSSPIDWRLDSGPNFASAGSTTKATALISTGAHFSKVITDISASDWNTCFISSGEVYCSGYNNKGQLGQGNASGPAPGAATAASQVVSANNAVKVGGALTGKVATRIVGGNDHFCAITNDGSVYCWGDNYFGQLGIGNTTNQYSPVQTKLPPPTIF